MSEGIGKNGKRGRKMAIKATTVFDACDHMGIEMEMEDEISLCSR